MIKINNLHKYFNKGKQNQIHVINGVNLELPQSGMVAVFGKSGCGKTTLLNVIGGLDSFESGTLSIDGKNMRAGADVLRNRYIGYIFQNYNLHKTRSCFDNVADALRLCGIIDETEIKTRVMAALRNVGLENYHARTPDTLSGGQQQRVAIARAIVKNPLIILADEPTGNLDEANTVSVMNLLKQISRDHLVLLVTHEAHLVDFYCDTVVELSDGQIVDIRKNSGADGYTTRSKNDIFLGELEHSASSDLNVEIDYYGDAPQTPIKLKVVNSGGSIYLRIDTPKVQLLDSYSEIKLREGVYEATAQKVKQDESIDMSALPPVEGTRFGRLFSFKSAVKSGYASNFKKGKKGKKLLFGCLCLFSAIIVMMSAVFGTSVAEIFKARDSYNHNVFYVSAEDAEVSNKLHEALADGKHGIDSLRLQYGRIWGDFDIKFMTGSFETFSTARHDESFKTNAAVLDASLAEGKKVLAGKTDNLSETDIVITSKVADALLDVSSLGYIDSYESLLGLITHSLTVDGKALRIAGIVDSTESAVYLGEVALARYVLLHSGLSLRPAADYEIDSEPGKVTYIYRPDMVEQKNLPTVGSTLKIQGMDVTLDRIIRYTESYDEWLNYNAPDMLTRDEYFDKLTKDTYPELEEYDYQFNVARDRLVNEKFYDYYEYRFSHFDTYLTERSLFGSDGDIYSYIYSQKGVELAKYALMQDANAFGYYSASQYKKQHGSYPTRDGLQSLIKSGELPDAEKAAQSLINQYQKEFDRSDYQYNRGDISNLYLVDMADYIEFSRRTGETDKSVLGGYYGDVVYGKYDAEVVYTTAYIGGSDIDTGYIASSPAKYMVIHTTDPDATEAFLYESFSDLAAPDEYSSALITPDGIFDDTIAAHTSDILTALIAMAVILAVMSVCMYFIMRSSLMNRIKEVGIYRAIGVSKKNLLFKFLIEALVLTTLTVFIGYALTSAFLFVCLELTPFMSSLLFYPVWLAVLILAILYVICIFFGVLPTFNLLRKTPSTILSKYDI